MTSLKTKLDPSQRHEQLMTLAKTDAGKALRQAAAEGLAGTIGTIVDRYEKVDVNGKSSNENTALMWAAKNGHRECVQRLLSLPKIKRDGAAEIAADAKIAGDINLVAGTAQDNVSVTRLLRYPNVYFALMGMDLGPNPKILVIGPGTIRRRVQEELPDGCSPQLTEIICLFPDAELTVVEIDEQNADTIRRGKFFGQEWMNNVHQPINVLYPTEEREALRKRFKDGFELLSNGQSPALRNLTVVCGDIATTPLEQNKFDVILGTNSVAYAFEAIRPRFPHDPVGVATAIGTQSENLAMALRSGGALVMDEFAGKFLDLAFDDVTPFRSRKVIAPPALKTEDHRHYFPDSVVMYRRK